MRRWPDDLKVAVNMSAVQFEAAPVQMVVCALAASGLAPHRLELEITESVLLQNNEQTLATLHQLRALGVRIAMDDFGTGYSSLSYLRSFPFDKIKIDRSFVADIAEAPSSLHPARGRRARPASAYATAEGVETKEQLERVRRRLYGDAGLSVQPAAASAEIERLYLARREQRKAPGQIVAA